MEACQSKIRQEIQARGGVLSFARFMELALYAPGLGYYERKRPQIGKAGDFYTNVSVGSLFGELLAARFAHWSNSLPGPITWVEAGAHQGDLAHDILTWTEQQQPELYRRIAYRILEPSEVRRQSQQMRLARFAGKIQWRNGWHDAPPAVRGIIFSNELLDAMPAHRIGWDAAARGWFEWGVSIKENQLNWRRMPAPELSPDFWPQLPEELLNVLPNQFTTEINPNAVRWWTDAAARLAAGKLMTIDYGLDGLDFFRPERREGTLRAFSRHHGSLDLLADVGDQDLTAQVNFTELIKAGERAGLKIDWDVSQAEFVTRIVMEIFPKPLSEWTARQRAQFQTLVHPDHLGRAFRVLVQGRPPKANFLTANIQPEGQSW